MLRGDRKLTDGELEALREKLFFEYLKVFKEYGKFAKVLMDTKIILAEGTKKSFFACATDGDMEVFHQKLKDVSKALKSARLALRKP